MSDIEVRHARGPEQWDSTRLEAVLYDGVREVADLIRPRPVIAVHYAGLEAWLAI